MEPNVTPSAKPLLSILVPSWNRENYLRRLLGVLLPVVGDNPLVELVVSNNGSTDGTAAFLDSLGGRTRVRVHHQPVNLGATIHIGWIYGQAHGTYLWMIGDDDLIESDLVATVCQILTSNPSLGWIHLPHKFTKGDDSLLSTCPAGRVQVGQGRELFPIYFRWLTFVTANVIRTDLLQRALPGVRFELSYWPAALLMTAVADQPATVLNERKVQGGWERTWADEFHEVTHFHLPLAVLNHRALSPAEKQDCLRKLYAMLPELLDRLIWLRPSLLLRIFRAAPQLCSPGFFTRVARKACRRLLSRRPHQAQPQAP